MSTTRLVVLSDVHISPPGPLATFHQGPALADLFEAQAGAGTTVVLAGDIVDFLQLEARSATLDMPGAPRLMAETLAAVAREPWGRRILDGIGALLQSGGRCVLLPGNHDPETFHPHARQVFLDAIGLPDHPGFTVHAEDAPWIEVVGGIPVRVGHGHRLDDWNDIDPEVVLRAVETGDAQVTLPPGSRLVLSMLNPLKRALHRSTGEQRFGFLDLLKPERATVLLLLPYLDWDAAEDKVPIFARLATRTFFRGLERALRRGAVLGKPTEEEQARSPEEALAEAIAGALPEEERRAPDLVVRSLRGLLGGRRAAAPGMLAQHDGLFAWCARMFLKRVAEDGSFFDPARPSREDRAVIEKELPEGSGPRIAIYGHTHAARHIDLGDGRVYLNTGTWMDLMRLPNFADDAEVRAWIDRLEAGNVERVRRPTYAEVTEGGAALRTWPVGAG